MFINFGGDIINNSDFVFIKGKIDLKLNDAFKKILDKKKITQQEFIELQVKEFVLNNINLLIDIKDKENK